MRNRLNREKRLQRLTSNLDMNKPDYLTISVDDGHPTDSKQPNFDPPPGGEAKL